MALTDMQARKAAPREKPYRMTDAGGMYLEVRPNGSKYWRMKYRIAGKEKLLALGVYPEVSLGEAREKRDEARKQVAQGIDPSAQRKVDKLAAAGRSANTFEAVAREWHGKRAARWSDSYRTNVLARLEQGLFSAIGSRPIAELTAPELLAALRRTESKGDPRCV